MCDSIDKKMPLMKPTFFAEDDVNNPKNKKAKEELTKRKELKKESEED